MASPGFAAMGVTGAIGLLGCCEDQATHAITSSGGSSRSIMSRPISISSVKVSGEGKQ